MLVTYAICSYKVSTFSKISFPITIISFTITWTWANTSFNKCVKEVNDKSIGAMGNVEIQSMGKWFCFGEILDCGKVALFEQWLGVRHRTKVFTLALRCHCYHQYKWKRCI